MKKEGRRMETHQASTTWKQVLSVQASSKLKRVMDRIRPWWDGLSRLLKDSISNGQRQFICCCVSVGFVVVFSCCFKVYTLNTII